MVGALVSGATRNLIASRPVNRDAIDKGLVSE